MEYSTGIIFLLGLLGVLAHTLRDINKKNKAANVNTNLKQYFAIEWAAIGTSIIVCTLLTIVKAEVIGLIKESPYADLGAGIGIFAICYMSNSVLTGFEKQAEKFIDKKTENTPKQP